VGAEHPVDLLLLLRALLLHVHVPQHSGNRIQGECAEGIQTLAVPVYSSSCAAAHNPGTQVGSLLLKVSVVQEVERVG